MGEMMTFPASVEEFMEQYKMTDTEHVFGSYRNYDNCLCRAWNRLGASQ